MTNGAATSAGAPFLLHRWLKTAENNGGSGAIQVLRLSVEKRSFKDEATTECLVVFSHVVTLKHGVDQSRFEQVMK